jgi:hypothetical protein
MVQPKLFPYLLGGERRAPLHEACFRETTVFEVINASFNQFASVGCFGPSRSLG